MTGDETVDSMFDEIKEVRMVSGKPFVSDEQQIAELDFKEACRAFVAAEKAFCKANATVRVDSSADVCRWWDLLEARYETEKRVWQLFIGGDRSPRSGRMYLQFRETLLTPGGKSSRADA
jgi:hypothetical protein